MSASRGVQNGDRTVQAFGRLLRRHRARRSWSQMDLGSQASVSARHISFLETGRSSPSPEMIRRLASALGASRRETNTMFLAAGYAPEYSEIDLQDPEAARAREVIEFLLERHEPFSALAFDRLGNIAASNEAHRRLLRRLLPDVELPPDVRENILRLLLHPRALRTVLVNRDEVTGAVLARFRQELDRHDDPARRALFEELAEYGLPGTPVGRSGDRESSLMLPVHLRSAELDVSLITVTTTLSAAVDVTLSELQIETYFPADPETEERLRALADEEGVSDGPSVRWRGGPV